MLSLLLATVGLLGQTYGLGRKATEADVRALGVTVAPDGTGLPAAEATAVEGKAVFAEKCARCHGEEAQGDVGPALVGGQGTLATGRPKKTVGSFWPRATPVWNYVKRAMPFDKPGGLTDEEVYAAVAYVLYRNGIVGEREVISARSLGKVKMPNRDGFVVDPRPAR